MKDSRTVENSELSPETIENMDQTQLQTFKEVEQQVSQIRELGGRAVIPLELTPIEAERFKEIKTGSPKLKNHT